MNARLGAVDVVVDLVVDLGMVDLGTMDLVVDGIVDVLVDSVVDLLVGRDVFGARGVAIVVVVVVVVESSVPSSLLLLLANPSEHMTVPSDVILLPCPLLHVCAPHP